MPDTPAPTPFRLDGRVALVTGSSRGLGKAIAIEFARAGAKVAINYAHDQETAEKTLVEIRELTADCCVIQADVTDRQSVEELCGSAANQLGPIDILVCNATCDQPELPFEEYDDAFFQEMFNYFTKSPVLLMRACLPHMKSQRFGRILQITSEVFALGASPFSAYVAAKGGQVGLSRSVARELAPFGITVNMIAPGWIPTERHAEFPQQQKEAYVAHVPAGRFGTPTDVATAAVFFASDEAGFVTGQTLSVNGGNTVW